MQISYRFGFDAAHHFPGYPAGHPYHGVHGHSFQAEVAIRGMPDAATGFIADLGQVENLSLWLWKRLAPAFPTLARVTVRRDSCGQACTYEGPG